MLYFCISVVYTASIVGLFLMPVDVNFVRYMGI